MPKYWRSKTLLAKIETSYGTDPIPTGAANAILATNVTFAPMEGTDVARNLERPWFAPDPTLPAGLYATITFSVEMVGSGTLGTAPGWGPLMRACRAAETVTAATKVEYTPITNNPESVALYFDIDGTLQKMLGTRGNVVMTIATNGIPQLTFTMTGLFSPASEATKPTVNYASFQAPQVGSSANTPTFTIGGTAFVLRELKLDLGNQVTPRLLIGQESILITGAAEKIDAKVEAVPVSTYHPQTIAQAGTLQAIVLQHGTVNGRRVRIDAPYAQQQRLTAYEDQDGILEWPLAFSPQPSVGNDQWKITLT